MFYVQVVYNLFYTFLNIQHSHNELKVLTIEKEDFATVKFFRI